MLYVTCGVDLFNANATRPLILILFSLTVLSPQANADWFKSNEVTLTLFGPNPYIGGNPVKVYSDHVTVSVTGAYSIDVVNGTPEVDENDCKHLNFKCFLEEFFHKENSNRVEWAEIDIDGKVAVSKSQFNEHVDHFYADIKLAKGDNPIVIKVQGKSTQKITVRIKEVIIAKPPQAIIKIVSAAQGIAPFTALFDASGSSDPQGYALTYAWDFGDGSTSTSGGLVPHEFLNAGNYNVSLTIKDSVGLSAKASVSVTVTNPVVPPPIVVTGTPPPPPATGVGSLSDSVSFLYNGPYAIQTGVAAGAIDTNRVAVLRGRVLDESGAPLPGVQITVVGSPQFGQTFTQSDGRFDMAVNGGGSIVVNYSRSGYLAMQRTIATNFQDYFVAPDVVLSRPDSKVTVVAMGAAVPQIAQGTPQTDSSGTRTATVMIPAQTTAQLVMPDGSTVPMPQLSLRATEFTVGPDGPSRMPGDLPPTSSYTYAVDISSDEGRALGAKHIQFSQPVPIYVDNFLGFQAGTHVPVGEFNTDTGLWDPQHDGRVINLLSLQNGSAVLDVTGNGTASSSDLSSLGITNAELQQIAKTYAAGSSFWRYPANRFSILDFNFYSIYNFINSVQNPFQIKKPQFVCSPGADALPRTQRSFPSHKR